MSSPLSYQNRTGRRAGRVVRALSAVHPGIARVWQQVGPYADAWHAGNVEALDRPGRRWFVLGDSLSQGVGASAYDAGWVGQLARRLEAERGGPARGQPVRHRCAGRRRPRPAAAGPRRARGPRRRPGDVLVGSNDLFGGRTGRSRLPQAYAELVDRVPVGSVVATLPQPAGPATQANVFVERAAAAGRIVMVDLRVTGPSSWRGRLGCGLLPPQRRGVRRDRELVRAHAALRARPTDRLTRRPRPRARVTRGRAHLTTTDSGARPEDRDGRRVVPQRSDRGR